MGFGRTCAGFHSTRRRFGRPSAVSDGNGCHGRPLSSLVESDERGFQSTMTRLPFRACRGRASRSGCCWKGLGSSNVTYETGIAARRNASPERAGGARDQVVLRSASPLSRSARAPQARLRRRRCAAVASLASASSRGLTRPPLCGAGVLRLRIKRTAREVVMLKVYSSMIRVLGMLRGVLTQIERHDWDLGTQLRRAASSVAFNIAEGERLTRGDAAGALSHGAGVGAGDGGLPGGRGGTRVRGARRWGAARAARRGAGHAGCDGAVSKSRASTRVGARGSGSDRDSDRIRTGSAAAAGSGSGSVPGAGSGAAKSRRGGAEGDRTPDLLHAMQALSQLSYSPEP